MQKLTILFDLDGTLIDTAPDLMNAHNHVMKKFGYETRSTDEIRNLVKRNIGGDQQRIMSLNTNYKEINFKHLLLPVYVSAYKYKNKLYRFLVNGRTGEVQGERPYSWIKISLTVLLVLTLVGAIYIYLEINR